MSRSRLTAVLIAVGGIALAAGACSAPAGAGGTTTTTTTTSATWVAPGCLDGAGTDGSLAPDLLYSGIPNHRGNATLSAVLGGGGVTISGNGSCSGQPVAAITIVRAADASAATTVCASIGAGTDPATSFAGTAWTLPADAFSCSETITL
jgi:hypothetical protein